MTESNSMPDARAILLDPGAPASLHSVMRRLIDDLSWDRPLVQAVLAEELDIVAARILPYIDLVDFAWKQRMLSAFAFLEMKQKTWGCRFTLGKSPLLEAKVLALRPGCSTSTHAHIYRYEIHTLLDGITANLPATVLRYPLGWERTMVLLPPGSVHAFQACDDRIGRIATVDLQIVPAEIDDRA